MVTNKYEKLCVTILSLLMGVAILLPFFSGGIVASAEGVNPTCQLGSDNGKTAKTCNDVNANVKAKVSAMPKFLTYGKDGFVTIDMSTYHQLTAQEKQDVMNEALSTISNSGSSKKSRLKLYNFVAEQDEAVSSLVRQLSDDVNPDFARAYSWFRPFSSTVSTILGFMCLMIFCLLGLMMVFDLSYMVIPPFKALIDKPSGEQPKFISKEAFAAVKTSEQENQGYKSALGIYFKLKVKQIVILGICLLYLVGGKIYDLVALIIDSLSGIIGI